MGRSPSLPFLLAATKVIVLEMVRTLMDPEEVQVWRMRQSGEMPTPGGATRSSGYAHGSVRDQPFHVSEVLLRGLQGD